MKNFLKIGLLAGILLTSSAVFANEDNFSLKANAKTEKSIVFLISEAQDINITIYGTNDELLYDQKIHASKPSTKIYNLEEFPDGSYTVKLENETKLIEYKVTIENGKTVVSEPATIELFKPVLTKDKETIILNMENTPNGEVEVKILNEYNEELYTKVFAAKTKLVKKFNVDKTDAKELTFIVKSKNQEFVKTIQLN
ncbi:hypothetical protein EZ428_23695 [Pedobacter frigiditerrae]|uniref:Por secretion system C-terminal sorting domain-containing protein n=1 Tax=Pedobacter frigiditerrae TaxID=2530452 RepID=A0A4R0MJA3_9SPHI|nr:hypothetical protein [Pedobacter frigiditerrae]TCC86473.1 hypothetical protein EZ428_23695 [Pedobacter frigiditerrae]